MPKRKRCVSDRDKKLLKLKHKIRKLERQRRHRSPSSSGSNSPSSQNSRSPLSSREVSPDRNGLSGVHKDPAKTYRRRIRVLSSSDEEFYIEGERQRGGNNEDGEDQDPLDQNLLELLGPNVSLNEVKGSNIQKDLAVRWEAILRQGVSIEDKNSIINDYPIPENCQALNPPRLNRIVSAAITDSTTRRDIKLSLNQTQIGAAVSAVGIAITALLKDKKEEHKSIIKQLSDAGRLMADLFYNQSQCRRELLLFNLNKDLKETLEKTEPSSWLFGDNLEEEIKTTKTLQRTSEELKQSSSKPKKISRSLNLKSLSRPNSGLTRGRQNQYNPSQRSAGYNPRHYQRQYNNQHNTTFYNRRQQEKKNRRALEKRQVPNEALDICMASVTNSTLKQYNSALKLWWEYCIDNNLEIFSVTQIDVLKFLSSQFHRGCSHGTLSSYRSAIGQITGEEVLQGLLLKRFFKGIYNLRPNQPKYDSIWDPSIVLDFIEKWNNDTLNLRDLTFKLTILLLLSTGQRVQTIANIEVFNIVNSSDGISIKIPLLKNPIKMLHLNLFLDG
nr:unnamed protein product [Callosobruchus chinensis]